MKTTSHPSVIRLFNNIQRKTPITSKGVYNRTDPTAFTKGEHTNGFLRVAYDNNGWAVNYSLYYRSTKIGEWQECEGVIEAIMPGYLFLLFAIERAMPEPPKEEEYSEEPNINYYA